MTLPIAILAGGLATRMRPATEKVPKSLLEVAGKPFVAHQLAFLRAQGVQEVVLCVGYLSEQVESVVGDGRAWGLHVRYSPDGAQLLGTGGALRKALPLLGEQFFVLYGDSFLPINFSAVEASFRMSGCPALMTVLRNENRWDKSNVVFRGGRVLHYDKRAPLASMEYIDYGLGILSAELLTAHGPDAPFDLADVYQALAAQQRLAGYQVHQRFYEIGSPEGLAETDQYLRGREQQ